ncbi:MAG: hypothetical protein AAGD05_07350, partial [Bacteroidota bacterium]
MLANSEVDDLGRPNKVVLPLELYGNLPLIDVEIDGLKGKLIFDTGASKLILNERYFEGGYGTKGTI